MKDLFLAVTSATAVVFAIDATADVSMTATTAHGEFENEQATQRHTLELRAGDLESLYGVLQTGAYDHPLDEISDRTMGGVGYHWRGWNAELVGDDDRYLASLIYTAQTDVWEIRGGVLHGNKWDEGFKQTGLKVSVGYPVMETLTVGGFYEIGNTTMKSVDDLYGGYIAARF